MSCNENHGGLRAASAKIRLAKGTLLSAAWELIMGSTTWARSAPPCLGRLPVPVPVPVPVPSLAGEQRRARLANRLGCRRCLPDALLRRCV